MERSRERSFCWRRRRSHGWRKAARPGSTTRFAEAQATGAETLATACPYCFVMLDDAAKAAASSMRVADVATLLAESTRRPAVDSFARWRPILLVRCDDYETFGVAPKALADAGVETG